MKRLFVALFGAAFLAACNTTVTPSKQALGVLEVSIGTDGLATAKLETGLRTQTLTYREPDVVFGVGSTQVVSATNSAFDYLVATFTVSHGGSSGSAFENLTLYALAKNGNIGGTALKSISNFGGVVNAVEQARIAKLLIPVHAVTDSGGNVVMDNTKADFQAFTNAEVTAAITAAGTAIGANDTILNYGFSAKCVTFCTTNSRRIPTGSTGSISIAIRVPKAAAATTYGFVMNFVVLDDDTSKVTKGVFPNETVGQAETRGGFVTATGLKQFGLNRMVSSTPPRGNDFIDDVQTSKLGASIQALGIGRISSGANHSCGLTSSGKAYCWGLGNSGSLGNGVYGDSLVPVAVVAPTGGSVLSFSSIAVGSNHSCGLTLAGAAYCWGFGSDGKLGNNPTTTFENSPVAVAAPTGGSVLNFSSISLGTDHTCGLTLTGAAYCWGSNFNGQLGNDPLTITSSSLPLLVSGGLTFSSISAGNAHSCGLTLTGAAYCWGFGGNGRLGNNATTNSSVPFAVVAPTGGSVLSFSSISAGNAHTCGVTVAGAAYCWGSAANGRLGDGTATNSSSPVKVTAPIVSGTPQTFSSISAGFEHSCAVTSSGAAYCWGAAANGRLGNNDSTNNANTPVAVLAPTGGNTLTFSSISAGGGQACGLTSSGVAYCWGAGNQLGYNSVLPGDTLPTDSKVPAAVDNSNFSL